MESSQNYLQILRDIFKHHSFEKLDVFRDPIVINKLDEESKELLSDLLLMLGKQQLRVGHEDVLNTFEWAQKASPDPAGVLYKQALTCFQHSFDEDNVSYLLLASKRLEAAVSMNPNYIDAIHLWGNVLVRLGLSMQETSYYQEADKKYAAVSLFLKEDNKKRALLYWDWGLCWHHLGKQSTEAIDFHHALEKYAMANDLLCKEADFFVDYANAMVEMGNLLKDKRWFTQAIETYRKSLDIDATSYETHFRLSCILATFYDFTSNESYYLEATHSFQTAAQLDPENKDLWLEWGKLLSMAGLKKGDLRLLAQSVDCYRRADQCYRDNSSILAHWGETLVFMASFTEDIECLKEAEKVIVRALEISPESIETWVIYGRCLLEFARYFHDDQYIHQAISYFQKAIKSAPKDEHAYRGLAVAYSILGEMFSDYTLYERALDVYAQCETLEHHPEELYEEWGTSLLKLAEVFNRREHIEAAVEKFELALEIQRSQDNINIDLLYNYGCALDYLGDYYESGDYYQKAIHTLDQVLVIDPGYSNARYNLALAYSHLGEVSLETDHLYQAIEHFQILSKEDPEDDLVWHDWGVTLITLSQIVDDPDIKNDESAYFREEAEGKLVKAASLGSIPALYHLACLYSICNHLDKSLEMLYRALNQHALPSSIEIVQDTWLYNVRQHPEFNLLVDRLKEEEV